MKHNLLALVGLLVVCVMLVLFRINWIKGMPAMSNKKVLESVAARITLDFVLVGITVYYWVCLRTSLEINPIYLLPIFMTAIFIVFSTAWGILRIKYKRPES